MLYLYTFYTNGTRLLGHNVQQKFEMQFLDSPLYLIISVHVDNFAIGKFAVEKFVIEKFSLAKFPGGKYDSFA